MANELTIYGDMRSGNCLKVKWTADLMAIPYRWIDTLAGTGATSDPAFLALNPQGQVPAVDLGGGKALAQSNAIVLHLAEGTDLIPQDAYDRARMWEAMFWEQYSHEPAVAVRRWRLHYQGQAEEDLDPGLYERGCRALRLMESTLGGRPWMACDRFSCADIALLAYTRMAEEGGFSLKDYPAVKEWIARAEAHLGLAPYVSPPRQVAG